MRKPRAVRWSLVTLAFVVLAATGAPAATAAPRRAESDGVGVTKSVQSVLSVDIGSLLSLEVLGDQGSAVTQDSLSALARITGIKLSSSALPGLNLAVPIVEAAQPGGVKTASNSLSLSNLLGGADLPVGLLSGDLLPINVGALLGDGTAAASGLAELVELDVLTSLLRVQGVTSTLDQESAPDRAQVTRSLDIDAISVLNIGSLLDLLGLDLLDLDLGQITGLLTGLGIPLTGAETTELTNLVGSITTLLDQVVSTVGDLAAPVITALNGLLTPIGIALPSGDTAITSLVSDLLGDLLGLLGGIDAGLDGLSLLNLEALSIGASAIATDAASTSSADASCALGSLQVANLVPIELGAVTDLLRQLTGTLTGILGDLPLGLGSLLNLSICGVPVLGSGVSTGLTENVATAGETITSTAGASALALSINPQAVLGALVSPTDSLGGLLGDLPLPLLNLLQSEVANDNPLTGLLPGVASLLSQGLSVKAASVDATAAHLVGPAAVPNAPTPAPERQQELANTGNEALPLLLAAAVLLPLAFLSRRYLLSRAASRAASRSV